MIDDLYQSGTDAALDDRVARAAPPKPAEPGGFSFWSTVGAGFRGFGAGVSRYIAGQADMAGAFGQVLGAYPEALGVGPVSAEQQAQAAEQRKKLIDSGIDYSSEAGDVFRARAADLMPDPVTAHVSEQLVGGFGQAFGVLGGSFLGAGPLAPLAFGGTEGLAEADKLKAAGVDLPTRTKAAAVFGAVQGATIVAPVVGRTAVETAALVGAAGPGAFVATNAAEQTILRHAGNEKQAAQYDPFDAWGLAAATVFPGALGTVAHVARARRTLADVVLANESGGRRFGPDGKLIEGPVTRSGERAQGEMQVMPATSRDPGFGVTPARDGSPDELARVGRDYLAAMQQRYGGDEAKAMAAYNAGPGAVDAAVKAHGDAWLAHLPDETRAYVGKGMRALGDERVAAAVADDPALVDAARVRQSTAAADASRLTPDGDLAGMNAHTEALAKAADQLSNGEPVQVADLVVGRDLDAARVDDIAARMPEAPPAADVVAEFSPSDVLARRESDLNAATQPITIDDLKTLLRGKTEKPGGVDPVRMIEAGAGNGRTYRIGDVPLSAFVPNEEGTLYDGTVNAARAAEYAARGSEGVPPVIAVVGRDGLLRINDGGHRISAARMRGDETIPAVISARRPRGMSAAEPVDAAPGKARAAAAEPAKPGERAAAAPADPVVQASERRLADLDPDMPVRLPDGEETTLGAALEAINREFDLDASDANLATVAAECFLRTA